MLKVERRWKKEGYTIGRMVIDGHFFCNTLEDIDRGLKSAMTVSEIQKKKIYGKTAIPTGTYRVYMDVSPKFKDRYWSKKYLGMVPRLTNVKGFDGILIHPGNKPEDTLGCILVGKNTIKGQVTQSSDTYVKLLDEYIVPALARGEEVYISLY